MPLDQQVVSQAAPEQIFTVFVVEDHATLRQMIVKLVNETAFLRVVGDAATAEDALADPQQSEADIIMTDLSLPGMSGTDLTRRLCAEDPERRIIVLSAYTGASTAESTFKAGAAAYITKDQPERIEATVKQVLSGERGVAVHQNGAF